MIPFVKALPEEVGRKAVKMNIKPQQTHRLKYAHITGWGSYLPERILTNDEIAQIVDTSDEWITQRTGIRQRRIAAESETTATMAVEAAKRALAEAKLDPIELDLIIVATVTPAQIAPSTACWVQHALGARNAGAFDLNAACSGFVYGFNMVSQAIMTGFVRKALVIGSETLSRILDWTDRSSCILFGDGAGAIVLEGLDQPGGVLAATLGADGGSGEALVIPAIYQNPVPTLGQNYLQSGPKKQVVTMNGREIFRFASYITADTIQEVLAKAGLTLDEIDLIIPHQANARIIESAAKRLGVSVDLFFMNLDRVGNTSSASTPLALCEAVKTGRLKPNDTVVFISFGGGLSWAANVVRWQALAVELPRMDYQLEKGWINVICNH